MPRRKKEKGIRGFGSVYQRGSDKRWVAKYKAEGTKSGYKEEYAHTDTEAYAKLEKAWLAYKQGIQVTGPNQKVKDYLDRWLEEVHKPTIRLSSYTRYRSILDNHILPILGQVQLQKLTPQQVQSLYTKKIEEGMKARSVHTIHAILHAALDNAVQWNLVARNVCDVVKPPRIAKAEIQPLNAEQAQKLLDVAKGHQLEAFLTVALTLGMRRGELIGLRWQDINFETRSLHIRRSVSYISPHGFIVSEPKTVKGKRNIVLPYVIINILKQHHRHQQELREKAGDTWQENDLVFSNYRGNYMEPSVLRKMFRRLLKRAGLEYIRLHDLRHSAATILLTMGIHPKVVQELLGHSSIAMTMDTYSHMLPSIQEEAMGKIDDLFFYRGAIIASSEIEGNAALSHEAEQPCLLCSKYEIQLPRVMRRSLVYISGQPERYTVQSISIHHPLVFQEQRYLHATGYAEIGGSLIMVQTTFCAGKLAWEPIANSSFDSIREDK